MWMCTQDRDWSVFLCTSKDTELGTAALGKSVFQYSVVKTSNRRKKPTDPWCVTLNLVFCNTQLKEMKTIIYSFM